jgi:hypothetical protein
VGDPHAYVYQHHTRLSPVEYLEDPATGCWVWQLSLTTGGYGQIRIPELKRQGPAHRVYYERLVGPIPEGLELDHLCRNRACVNPSHLEPVTHQVNGLRGVGPCAENARKTHCIRGHELAGANLYVRRDTGRRQCKACRELRKSGLI